MYLVGLFGPEDEEEQFVFQRAVDEANADLRRTQWNLIADVISLKTYDSFYLSKLRMYTSNDIRYFVCFFQTQILTFYDFFFFLSEYLS